MGPARDHPANQSQEARVPYATQSDIETLYGPDALLVAADRDGDGLPDAERIAAALADAAAEIDSHVGVRHALPLPAVPAALRRIAADIALYRLASNGAALTEELRTRYQDAIAWLRRVADGKAALPGADPQGGSRPTSGGPSHAAPPRVFDDGFFGGWS